MKCLLVYLHQDLDPDRTNKIIHSVCFNKKVAKTINTHSLPLGLLDNSAEAAEFAKIVETRHWPCLAIVKKGLFDKPELVNIVKLNDENLEPVRLVKLIKQSIAQYN